MDLLSEHEKRAVTRVSDLKTCVSDLRDRLNEAIIHYTEQPKTCMDEVDEKFDKHTSNTRWMVGTLLGIPAAILTIATLVNMFGH